MSVSLLHFVAAYPSPSPSPQVHSLESLEGYIVAVGFYEVTKKTHALVIAVQFHFQDDFSVYLVS